MISTEKPLLWSMIHSFSISNYGSVQDEVTLDLRIRGTAPDLACFRRSAAKPALRVPAVAVLMGPNGSGKTTIMRALVDMMRYVSSLNETIWLVPFLNEETHWQPTRFSLEGEWDWLSPGNGSQRFRYELVVGRMPSEDEPQHMFLIREVLLHFPKGRKRRLYERRGNGAPVYVSRDFGIRPSDDRLRGLGPTTSLIAMMAMFDVPLARRIVEWMLGWLGNTTNVFGNDTRSLDTRTAIRWIEANPESKHWAEIQLGRIDAGIRSVEVARDGEGSKFVQFEHSGLDHPVILGLESNGTRHLFHLLPMIKYALDATGLAVLDEIDGDLHVDVVAELLRLFRSRESNPRGAQLLLTSHHAGLLDELEKEEIFIVEKDEGGATQVYGAQDVRGLRRDVRLYLRYRSGALGGIPRIG